MFTNFVEVSIYKHSTNISNDMTKKLIFAAALLFEGTAAAFAQPKVIAHRGYWTAPNSAQNSLASFSKADSVGAFGSEMDVWLSEGRGGSCEEQGGGEDELFCHIV